MAATDPRTTIYNIVSTNLGNIKLDDGATNAKIIHIWSGGPETMKYLFFSAGAPGPYEIIVSYDMPRSRSDRNVQDVPVHYLMSYGVTVTITDKPISGVLVCTGMAMMYKVTYALRAAVKAFAQSAIGAAPAYTLKIISDDAVMNRVGGLKIWETKHLLEYETDYA